MTVTIIDQTTPTAEITLYDAKDTTSLGDTLEEALYVLQELTPTKDKWFHHLRQGESVTFDYHGCEFFNITRFNDTTFEIRDY